MPWWCIQLTKDMFLTIFFGYFALVNYQVLQTLHQAHSMGLYQEDEWWRRVGTGAGEPSDRVADEERICPVVSPGNCD